MYERVQESYNRVAARYAEEASAELEKRPLDRALLRCLVELAAGVPGAANQGRIADIGCGPGHVAAYLAGLGTTTIGIDISSGMLEIARSRVPDVQFRLGTMLAVPATDAELNAAVAFYSIIHLRPEDRPTAYQELARVIAPGGYLLVAFHINLAGHEPGEIMHADEWWGERVDLDFYYIEPAEVVAGLAAAGFDLVARTDREPVPSVEHQSRRCYLLCRRT
jgi:ubiquinone/menaquinone biosynthesis C-methylase UbiE